MEGEGGGMCRIKRWKNDEWWTRPLTKSSWIFVIRLIYRSIGLCYMYIGVWLVLCHCFSVVHSFLHLLHSNVELLLWLNEFWSFLFWNLSIYRICFILTQYFDNFIFSTTTYTMLKVLAWNSAKRYHLATAYILIICLFA